LSARYDTALMEPPVPGGAIDPALLAQVRAWCDAGAWTVPLEPLRVASIAPHAALEAVANELDGSHALARLPRWQGLAWRLAIVLRERLPGGLGPGDPWDCGWWRTGALAPAAAFMPRRATLLLVHEADAAQAQAQALLAALAARSAGYHHPVRVLCVATLAMRGMDRL